MGQLTRLLDREDAAVLVHPVVSDIASRVGDDALVPLRTGLVAGEGRRVSCVKVNELSSLLLLLVCYLGK